ncbi:MAG: 23S rRNA (adenine(2503)-C(2))-methyltransferase RlmN [Candidatus Cloacimonetes bacterium]|nr:23S rRNA (adenine(2503)-C(2))-methyltransferase RlmN [Candidatus Cloacimonadota bacterium]
MRHILDYHLDDLKTKLHEVLMKPYKVNQVMQWVYKKHTLNFEDMTNISKEQKTALLNAFETFSPKIIETRTSTDGTTKFLLELSDNHSIEMVFMPDGKKHTLCISTQVGCGRGCSFCATAKIGLKRNLSQAELVSQLHTAYNYFPDIKITNLVLMGMGEPLDNYDALVSFLHIVNSEEGFSFSARRVTVSTCGVVPKIYSLAESGIKVKLAVSLNSAIDKYRSEIMPINKNYPLDELKKASIYFRKKTSFRITFEYIMIANVNMEDTDIKAIMKFCGDISCKLNLIKWNEVKGMPWKSPTENQIQQFVQKLRVLPVAITIRKSKGADITGACGQLSGNKLKQD